MKQSRATIFAIIALGLLLALAQGSPLHAQNQPQATACPLEGPSIADTLKYINDGLESSHSQDVSVAPQTVSVEESNLIINRDYSRYPSPIYELNCQSVSGIDDGTGFGLLVRCHAGNCVRISRNTPDGWRDASPAAQGFLMIGFHCDRDACQRFTRAFAHLIGLLQQQYKQSHSDPNDPFAKPQ
jgi:hypothetical protein